MFDELSESFELRTPGSEMDGSLQDGELSAAAS